MKETKTSVRITNLTKNYSLLITGYCSYLDCSATEGERAVAQGNLWQVKANLLFFELEKLIYYFPCYSWGWYWYWYKEYDHLQ